MIDTAEFVFVWACDCADVIPCRPFKADSAADEPESPTAEMQPDTTSPPASY